MITEFTIENYKSIERLSINLGRVNVLIGENGCGKSNILEAFTLASAATQNKLDNEFLAARGIRVTQPQFMRSAFDKENITKAIKLGFSIKDEKIEFELNNDNEAYSTWKKKAVYLKEGFDEEIKPVIEQLVSEYKGLEKEGLKKSLKWLYQTSKEEQFKDFLIYSPENTSLRTFEKEGQIQPLGIYGEGLFKLLKYFASKPETGALEQVKNYLKLFDWFTDFVLPERLFEGESYLQIKDRFLDATLNSFDQKSANEGFLFVLFYFSLMISDKTPDFFAIDNIESSLNPKLCTKLIKSIAELSKQHNKQVIVTTHSPSILDGLDLNDDQQKLFLVYRNKIGRTVLRQVEKPKPLDNQEPIKLSEAFLRGYLGGLPKNFAL